MRPLFEFRVRCRFLVVGGAALALFFLPGCSGRSGNAPQSAPSAIAESTAQATSEVSQSDWMWVSEPASGFTASVPAHWQREIRQEPDTRTTYFSYRPSNVTEESQPVTVDVVVSHDRRSVQDINMSASALMRRLEELQMKQGDNVLIPPRTTSLGSYPAAWSVSEYTPQDSTETLRAFAVFASTNSAFYVVRVAGLPENGEEIEAVFEHLRDTIQLTESKWTPIETQPTPQQTESTGTEPSPPPEDPSSTPAAPSQEDVGLSIPSTSARIIRDDVNLRQSPSRKSGIVSSIPKGATVTVIGRLPNSTWLKVSWKGHTAWVRTELVSLRDGKVQQIPVVPR